jgi:hypothetical protein
MVFTTLSTGSALGAVVTRVPTISDLDEDSVECIRTGGSGDLVPVAHRHEDLARRADGHVDSQSEAAREVRITLGSRTGRMWTVGRPAS